MSVVSSGLSDLSEETPPQRKSTATPVEDKSLNLSKRAMTPEEKKKHKEEISEKYFKLMEKYGPKRRFLQQQQSADQTAEDMPPMDPVGFVIKFRLSHAYKALENQEIEAAVPNIKPVRKRKRTKFLLPPEEPKSERGTGETARVESSTGRPSSATGTANSNNRTRATRRVQIRIRSSAEKENDGGGGGKGGVWQNLTKQKASAAVQLKEKQQREERQGQLKSGKGLRQSKDGQSNKKGQLNQSNQKQSNQRQLNQRQDNAKQSNQKQSNQKQTLGGKGNKVGDPRLTANKPSKGMTQEERQRSIERSLAQVRADTKQRQDRKSREMWDSHFQGIGGMGLPGSVGAATTEYSSGDSVFRMFSDSCFSGSITMDAVTMTCSRPSSPSKSLYDAGSRPSSGRRLATSTPKPRTSTPAGRAVSPSRPQTARVRTPTTNARIAGDRRRAQSATPSNGKGKNDTMVTVGKGKQKSITAILRLDGKPGGKEGGGDAGKEGADANKVLAPRKICKYLYHMCNCHQVARKETLSKLFKTKKVVGVIDLFGCPDSRDPRSRVLSCPFCGVMPQRRINNWLDNLDD